MEKNKIITYIFTVIFITVFSIFNFWEYNDFHSNKNKILENSLSIEKSIQNFELTDIKKIEDIELYHTPSKILLEDIVELIKNAKKEIYLETYILTEKRIQNALLEANNNQVKIKVILEKNPYKAYNINNKAYNKLQKAWIDIVWSDSNNYSYNHSKLLIIDELSIISTGNYSYSTFTKNRDLFIFTKDKNLRSKLIKNFSNDYTSIKTNIFDENLIFSPKTSRVKFEKLFDNAKENIKMYFQYLKDEELITKLIKLKQEKNISIEIVIAKTAIDDDEIKQLKDSWIIIKALTEDKMHSKAILIDNKYLYIWSINFSSYSLDRNREIWIILSNEKIIKKFLEIFNNDFK